jgi:hypothetical protein
MRRYAFGSQRDDANHDDAKHNDANHDDANHEVNNLANDNSSGGNCTPIRDGTWPTTGTLAHLELIADSDRLKSAAAITADLIAATLAKKTARG